MRSSKSRSRNKNNRNRPSGNVVNRVFDSSGPEGKVRGTPQQIIEKYNQLARDAQLGNDRVAAENFQQHAEHYLRMLADAQREQAERQQQQQQNQQNQQQNQNRPQDDDGAPNSGGDSDSTSQRNEADTRQETRSRRRDNRSDNRSSDVIDVNEGGNADSGLVETPEEKPQRPRRSRKKPAAEADTQPEGAAPPDAAE